MSIETMSALKISRTIKADRASVWNAWTQPEHVRRWACPVPGGAKAYDADLRVGGSYTLSMEIEGQPHTAVGEYREVDPPSRLVYTWDWKEAPMGGTLVTVEFEELDGATVVTLTHEGFPDAEAKGNHEQGWTACMSHFTSLFDA